MSYPRHRLGWSPQVPAQRAAERDGRAVAVWRTERWSRARGRGAWTVFGDAAGQDSAAQGDGGTSAVS
ncbi:winged helix-turn-helix domain-containing protein [Streptomyces sanyensis]|uniref:winged helix-turn-helix domain-containing protein n=1 Tax=Streptomyces sanyensis TaxID=568869 RepID=UPI003D77DDFF